MVSTMPSAVSGLTKHDAPSAGVAPSGRIRHCPTLTQRYCEYMAPPKSATVLPSSACAAPDDPAATTTPAPSLPTGIDWSTRPAMLFIRLSGMRAVTIGLAAVPEAVAVLMSAAPNSSPRSEGLIGVASTRTTTSSGSRKRGLQRDEREFELAAPLDQRAELKPMSWDDVVHSKRR